MPWVVRVSAGAENVAGLDEVRRSVPVNVAPVGRASAVADSFERRHRTPERVCVGCRLTAMSTDFWFTGSFRRKEYIQCPEVVSPDKRPYAGLLLLAGLSG